jgi:hypothetical protein
MAEVGLRLPRRSTCRRSALVAQSDGQIADA